MNPSHFVDECPKIVIPNYIVQHDVHTIDVSIANVINALHLLP